MRIIGFALLWMAVATVHAAKPDSAVYPNANSYRDPAISLAPQLGYAKVIREYCPGQGRGQIHFLEVDGRLIRIRKTWPTYLELAPGHHGLGMEFIGPATSIWGTWQGVGETSADFESGKAYVVRYQRTATDAFRVWIEAYDGFESVDMNTVSCKQPAYPDPRLHQ